MSVRSLILFATTFGLAVAAEAAALAPHQAVYELTLSSKTTAFVDAEGRIAMELRADTCGVYNLDYRFVARFQQEQEFTVTDQQTISTEDRDGTTFAFTTKTFVDGSPEQEIRGEARHDGDATKVAMASPVKKSFDLPLSRFPMQHMVDLIERAKAGERIVEAKLFDGDEDAEKLLTTTAIITPNDEAPPPAPAVPKSAGEAVRAAVAPDIAKRLAGLKSWRISESYYNSDSDPDGLPVFETSYLLYENGVSDDLTLNFGAYAFTGSLSKLDLLDASTCK